MTGDYRITGEDVTGTESTARKKREQDPNQHPIDVGDVFLRPARCGQGSCKSRPRKWELRLVVDGGTDSIVGGYRGSDRSLEGLMTSQT